MFAAGAGGPLGLLAIAVVETDLGVTVANVRRQREVLGQMARRSRSTALFFFDAGAGSVPHVSHQPRSYSLLDQPPAFSSDLVLEIPGSRPKAY